MRQGTRHSISDGSPSSSHSVSMCTLIAAVPYTKSLARLRGEFKFA